MKKTILLNLVVLLLTAALAPAATRLVPDEYSTIQAAIDDSNSSDEIIVFPGVYYENINFCGKDIILRSTEPTNQSVISSTIIDGDFVGSVVRFSGSETESCVLSGFTITNGRASGGVGGGIYCPVGSSPTVTNCTISGSWATGSGGGIGGAGSPTITNCIITGNEAVWDTGGGISLWGGSATIVNCKISGNLAYRGGGGIHFCNGSQTINNCTINANTAYKGAGIYCEGGSSPIITNCIIAGNSAERYGGGIDWAYSNPTLTNCTFAANSAANGNAIACGPCRSYPCKLQLTNSILWDGGDEIWNKYGSSFTITYSDVQGGQMGIYDPCEGLVWGDGNINTDPCFVDPGYWDPNGTPDYPWDDVWIEGDYHLLPRSPCINAGDPNFVPEPNETDIDGRPRIIGGRIDMGAYEYSPPIPAEVRIVPRTINLASRGKWITGYIWLGEDYDVADIDSNSVFLEGEIEAQSLLIDEQQQVAIVRFSRSEVQNILEPGEVELTISGELTDGARFEGNDIIRVIDKGGKK